MVLPVKRQLKTHIKALHANIKLLADGRDACRSDDAKKEFDVTILRLGRFALSLEMVIEGIQKIEVVAEYLAHEIDEIKSGAARGFLFGWLRFLSWMADDVKRLSEINE